MDRDEESRQHSKRKNFNILQIERRAQHTVRNDIGKPGAQEGFYFYFSSIQRQQRVNPIYLYGEWDIHAFP